MKKLKLWQSEILLLKEVAETGKCEECDKPDNCCFCTLNIFDNTELSCQENAKMFLELLQEGGEA